MIENGPLVSVVMPIYNVELFLKEAVDSILSQTYLNFEFIIINDGSTDESDTIMKQYTDNRIKYINHANNKGNYNRRNEGCKLAKGKYICVMDGDDIAMPHRLAKQVQIMEDNKDILAMGSDFEIIGGGTSSKPKEPEYLKVMLLANNMFLHPSLIIRQEIFKEVNYYNEQYYYSSDYDLMCKIALVGKIINIEEPLMQHRLHQDQISSSHFEKQKAFANEIRVSYLENCGFILTQYEKKIFTKWMSKDYTLKDIDQINELKKLLRKQNIIINAFDSNMLEKILS